MGRAQRNPSLALVSPTRRATAIRLSHTCRLCSLCLESKASALAHSKAEALDSKRLGGGA